jgi:competence protein CoiA
MKFANIEGHRREAEPGLSATCPYCSSAVIAKCGDLRRWHWAHRSERDCDHWWESETDWHRDWKNEFPPGWQEIIHNAQDDEKHVADVKTETGMVIEFQHSPLKPEERMSREAFYGKMVWVVDGRRRKRDAKQLLKCVEPYAWTHPLFTIYATNGEECALLRDWNASGVPVYFDLGDQQEDGQRILWRRNSRKGRVCFTPVPREFFLNMHREGLYAEAQLSEEIGSRFELAAQPPQWLTMPPPRIFRPYPTRRGPRRL